MVTATGVHLLPATGEFTYDTIPYFGFQRGASGLNNGMNLNTLSGPTSGYTDYRVAMDQLQAQHPECATVSLVCAWFFNSEDASQCNVYPSTNFLLGEFLKLAGGAEAPPPAGLWVQDHWQCSGLTEQNYPGIIPLPALPGTTNYVYGGTPSDPGIVRCIQDLKSRGFRVIFYPFLLGTGPGFPWRGRIGFSPDVSSAATAAVNAFLGSAAPAQFVRDPVNLTVNYLGGLYDWTYRRMILHYANLCVLAGGVDLFVIGSELRGLETIRGPSWTPAGTTDSAGKAVWDYPFVAGLIQLADDVRSVFDAAGLTKNPATLKNLITYSADWSSWMGFQHPGAGGQWPHLDQLWAHSNIDVVSFDNYLPLSDWTTGNGGLDALNWSAPAYSGPWPPPAGQLNGLGFSGPPSIYSPAYLKRNVEGGEFFDWFYNDGANLGRGLDPNGSGLMVSRPEGDRLAQARSAYSANQQILAPKQLRWWWNNPHQAVYANASGAWVPQGPQTEWSPQAKSIVMLEYGFSAVDKATNQPNVFFDPKSSESFTPYWSIWDSAYAQTYLPRRDDTIAALALQAVYDYWNTDGHNASSSAGLPMLQWTFACVWNWDARPFPTFPVETQNWGDAGNWRAGDWSNGLRTSLPPVAPTAPAAPGPFETFPALATVGWSIHVKPKFSTDLADHVSGRSTRRARYANPLIDVELTYEVLRSAAAYQELQTIAGFFAAVSGGASPFWFAPPGALGAAEAQAIGTGDGTTTNFALVQSIGAATLPVAGTSGVSAVYLNGVAQSSGWSVLSGYAPIVTFATAPNAGQAVTADFGVVWLCRFAEDVQDFEEFMAQLFALRTLRLSTVRP